MSFTKRLEFISSSVTSIDNASGTLDGLQLIVTTFKSCTKIPPNFTPSDSPSVLNGTSREIF